MSRTDRFFELIGTLRSRRTAITASELARELRVSPRTIYRDIETLRSLGAPVIGQAGVGFLLKKGFFLPEFAFSPDEMDALILGLGWVRQRADPALARAGEGVLMKVRSARGDGLPACQEQAELVSVAPSSRSDAPLVARLRDAVRMQRKVSIGYEDANGSKSERVIWPISIVYFDDVRILAAWCERRSGFRHFRVDRVSLTAILEDRYPGRRQALVAQWRRQDRNWRSILTFSGTAAR